MNIVEIVAIIILIALMIAAGVVSWLNRKKKTDRKGCFKTINNAYYEVLLNGQASWWIIVYIALACVMCIFIFCSVLPFFKEQNVPCYALWGSVFCVVFIFVIYIFMGWIFVSVFQLSNILQGIRKTTANYLFICFLIELVEFIILIYTDESSVVAKCITPIGLAFCYVTLFSEMIRITFDPEGLIRGGKINTSSDLVHYFKAVGFILSMVVMNLYLLVLWNHIFFPGTYEGVGWDGLLYYTIISFTTVGYGDITPHGFWGKLIAVVIAITSVVSLVIFLGSVLSIDKHNEDDDDTISEDDENKQTTVNDEKVGK